MGSTVAGLVVLRNVGDICAWVGIDKLARTALFAKIGLKYRALRDVVAIIWSTWCTAPVEEVQVGCFRRVCRSGLVSRRGGPASPRLLLLILIARPTWVDASTRRKVKLGNTLDQAEDSEIAPLPANDVSDLIPSWAAWLTIPGHRQLSSYPRVSSFPLFAPNSSQG